MLILSEIARHLQWFAILPFGSRQLANKINWVKLALPFVNCHLGYQDLGNHCTVKQNTGFLFKLSSNNHERYYLLNCLVF